MKAVEIGHLIAEYNRNRDRNKQIREHLSVHNVTLVFSDEVVHGKRRVDEIFSASSGACRPEQEQDMCAFLRSMA